MKDKGPDLTRRIADSVREIRTGKGLSLDALARRSRVSRSMISLIERGESSPTAVVLDKVAQGLGVTLALLFDRTTKGSATGPEPISRRAERVAWRDPASGYIRCNVTPSGIDQPMQIVEVHFPAKGRVAFENGPRAIRVYQQVWVLKGAIDILLGDQRHRLREGDCLAMQLDRPTTIHNPTLKPARYAVVVASNVISRR